jgi:hypothetical protein
MMCIILTTMQDSIFLADDRGISGAQADGKTGR